MKKMTPEELTKAFEVLADEKHATRVFRASERIRQHIAALEADVAQAQARMVEMQQNIGRGNVAGWDRAREEVANEALHRSRLALDFGRRQGLEELVEWIRSLKSNPAQERPVDDCGAVGEDGLCTHPSNTTPECHKDACPLVEMASEENGLLPKRRRREHEYGDDVLFPFGATIATCVRDGCYAYRLKTRGGKTTLFRQDSSDMGTRSPGPCEVGP